MTSPRGFSDSEPATSERAALHRMRRRSSGERRRCHFRVLRNSMVHFGAKKSYVLDRFRCLAGHASSFCRPWWNSLGKGRRRRKALLFGKIDPGSNGETATGLRDSVVHHY
jgi:hypothetical protein